jgi:hypothetical protein
MLVNPINTGLDHLTERASVACGNSPIGILVREELALMMLVDKMPVPVVHVLTMMRSPRLGCLRDPLYQRQKIRRITGQIH